MCCYGGRLATLCVYTQPELPLFPRHCDSNNGQSPMRQVVFDPERLCFVDSRSGKAARGLTKCITRTFGLTFKKSGSCGRRSNKIITRATQARSLRGPRVSALSLGRLVDRQVREAGDGSIIGHRNTNEPRRRRVVLGAGNHRRPSTPAPGRWRAQAVEHHPYAAAVQRCLAVMGLTVVTSQVPVHDSTGAVATAVDLLCEDRHHRIAVVEVKVCGLVPSVYAGLVARVGPQPRDRAGGVAKTHQVQLALTRLFYDRCHPGRKSSCAYVVCSGASGATAYRLSSCIWDAAPVMCEQLVAAVTRR